MFCVSFLNANMNMRKLAIAVQDRYISVLILCVRVLVTPYASDTADIAAKNKCENNCVQSLAGNRGRRWGGESEVHICYGRWCEMF